MSKELEPTTVEPTKDTDPKAGDGTEPKGDLGSGRPTARVMTTGSMVRSINLEVLEVDRADGGDGEGSDDREVMLAVSSEFEVIREGWPFDGIEILDHSPGSVRLDRFKDGAAVVAGGHFGGDLVAANRDAWVGDDRRLWIKAAFSTVADAERELTLVREGIRRNVSIRYRIHKFEHTIGEGGAPDVYRATDWEPIHTALVNDPEDPSVGFDRDAKEEFSTEVVTLNGQRETPTPKEGDTMPEGTPAATVTEAERAQIAKERDESNQARIGEILSLGRNFNRLELATASVERGDSVVQFKDALLDSQKPGEPLHASDDPADLGMSERETERYSFFRALRYLQDRSSPALAKEAGLEIEASRAIESATGEEPQGLFIPTDALRSSINISGIVDAGLIPEGPKANRVRSMMMGRAVQTSTTLGGGNLIPTDHLAASFIDILRNSSAVMGRATVLTGLTGNVDIPTKSIATVGAWLAEGADTAADDITFGNLPLTPHDIGAHVIATRRLLMQSSPAVEDLIRMDLAMAIALGVDLSAISGSGVGAIPEGFLNNSAIGDYTLVTAPDTSAAPTWQNVLEVWKLVAEANGLFGDMGWLMGAAHAAYFMGKDKGTDSGNFIMDDVNTMMGYGVTISEQCPADTVAFLNFRQIVVGMWGGVDMLVDPYSGSKSGNILIRAIQSADVGVRQAGGIAAWQDSAIT